jgi:tetratricopeptide (TPR) repeat protein
MEASWLAAAAALPLFFNISSAQVFEPDKTRLLILLTAPAGAAWLAKRIQGLDSGGKLTLKENLKRFLPALPVAVLAAGLAAVYVLSSIFSLEPALSWLGNYTRAQGTVVFLCYVIMFGVVLSELRTREQINRILYSLVAGSVPIGLYAILQHLGADPLRWSNPIAGRPSASMGNPIFLGAYLAMVIPLAFGLVMGAVRRARRAGKRIQGYAALICSGAVLALDAFALFVTKSRGPALGLAAAAYVCMFLWLVLERNTGKQSFAARAAAVVLGLLVPALPIALLRFSSGFGAHGAIVWAAAAIAAIALAYLVFYQRRRFRGVLWLAWLAQTAALVGVFLIGPSRLAGEGLRAIPALGRFTTFSDTSAGVRMSLWRSAVDALRSARPIPLEEGREDAFHPLRRAIGYGPESIGFVANAYAAPELVKVHTGEAVDRMHNDLFDNLISIGAVGAALFLALVALGVLYALRCLGFPCRGRRGALFWALVAFGCASGAALPAAAGLPQLSGAGVHAGLLAGVFAFAAWSGFSVPDAAPRAQCRTLALMALAALLAHFIELSFGIAVTVTRLYFFILLAVLGALAAGRLEGDVGPPHNRAAKARVPKRNPLLPFAAASSFVFLAAAWCFVINTEAGRGALSIFLRTWFGDPKGGATFLPGAAILVAATLGGCVGVMYVIKPDPLGSGAGFLKAAAPCVLWTAAVWTAMGVLSSWLWTMPGAASPVEVSARAESRMTLFVAATMALWTATAAVLVRADAGSRGAGAPARGRALGAAVLLAGCVCAAAYFLCLRPAWADMARRIAGIYEYSDSVSGSIPVYERAVEFAPRVAGYRVSLGSALVRVFMSEKDPGRREPLLAAAESSYRQALDISPLDPAVQRAMGNFYARTGETLSEPAARAARLRRAIPFFRQAARLAPNYPEAYLLESRCHFLLGEHDRAEDLYQKALRMNPRFYRTHMLIGEIHYRKGELDPALESFMEASRLSPWNIEARKNAGAVLERLGRKQEAVAVYLEALNRAPGDYQLLQRLASLYFSLDDYARGVDFARRAFDASPPADKVDLDSFLRQLQTQAKQ